MAFAFDGGLLVGNDGAYSCKFDTGTSIVRSCTHLTPHSLPSSLCVEKMVKSILFFVFYKAEPHSRDKRQTPNVVFSIWHFGDFSLARSGQTPNAKHHIYTIINAVNKLLLVLSLSSLLSFGHPSLKKGSFCQEPTISNNSCTSNPITIPS